jgi:hypothetical protein
MHHPRTGDVTTGWLPRGAALILATGCGTQSIAQSQDQPSGAAPAIVAPAPADAALQVPETAPAVVLDNGLIQAKVYLPDNQHGYYRGVRFDRSGHIARVQSGPTRFFGPWKDVTTGTGHDDVVGTAEEFSLNTHAGYDQAKPGEPFMKIGVGMLRRESDEPYRFSHGYPLLDPGQWHIEHGRDFVETVHTVAHESGLGYRYVKRVQLLEGQRTIAIQRELTNTGSRPIREEHYTHNFVQIDDEPISPRYELRLPFPARPTEKPQPKLHGKAALENGVLRVLQPMKGSFWVQLDGLTGTAADHAYEVRHASGAILRAWGDTPLAAFIVWCAQRALCPEMFTAIDLAPGQTKRWTLHYEFVPASGQ